MLQILHHRLQVSVTTVLAPPQSVPPGAIDVSRSHPRGRRSGSVGSWDEDLVGVGCWRCVGWNSGGWGGGWPLGGGFVVFPQHTHERCLLLGLFCLLLHVHLLPDDHLNVLLGGKVRGKHAGAVRSQGINKKNKKRETSATSALPNS